LLRQIQARLRDVTSAVPRIALIGDLHASWDHEDSAYFSRSDYEKIVITGDLGNSGTQNGISVARALARIERDTLVMLGNNDAEDYASVIAELNYQAGRARLFHGLEGARISSDIQRVQACGYSKHRMQVGTLDLTLIAARPFAMGNSQLSFPAALADAFQISSLEESAARLCALVDQSETEHLVFLAHNGPTGLGELPSSPFGRDFHPDAGDWGDQDLAQAILHALSRRHRVLAVIAGHMHWRLKSGGMRRWCLERDGVLYINAACVPRHDRTHGRLRRHHLALTLTHAAASVEEVWVDARPDPSNG